MNAKKNFSGLKKATAFIEKLPLSLIDLLCYPTLKVKSDYVEVCFYTHNVIRDFLPLQLPADEFRIFSEMDNLVLIYTFYNVED